MYEPSNINTNYEDVTYSLILIEKCYGDGINYCKFNTNNKDDATYALIFKDRSYIVFYVPGRTNFMNTCILFIPANITKCVSENMWLDFRNFY